MSQHILDEKSSSAEHIEAADSLDKGVVPQKPANEGTYGALHIMAQEESGLSTGQSIQKYRVAFCYALFISCGAILTGFDGSIASGVIGVPAFRNNEGYSYNGGMVVSAAWQSGWSGASKIGQTCGGLAAGFVADRFGRKSTIYMATLFTIVGTLLEVLLKNQGQVMLLFGRTFNACAQGIYGAMASNYAAEVSPLKVKGVTTGGVNLFVVIGQFLAAVVLQTTGTRTDKYAYIIPYAVQWFFPLFLICGLPFIPESPWYLVRRNRPEDALRSLSRILRGSGSDPALHLRAIQETIELESHDTDKGTYIELFKGKNLRRTGIASMAFLLQETAGVQFVLGYSTYFFELAGFKTADAFKLTVGTLALAIVGNLLGLAAINSFGRRKLFILGMITCTTDCLLIGVCSCIPGQSALWAMASFTMLYMLAFQSGIGPVAYCIYAEISSAKMRSKTIGWGVLINNLSGGLVQVINPYLINPNEANLEGKVGWIFGGMGVFGTIYSYFFIPETKGMTVDQVDELFERNIPSRLFHRTEFRGLEYEVGAA